MHPVSSSSAWKWRGKTGHAVVREQGRLVAHAG
jgi:hypothetical protein